MTLYHNGNSYQEQHDDYGQLYYQVGRYRVYPPNGAKNSVAWVKDEQKRIVSIDIDIAQALSYVERNP